MKTYIGLITKELSLNKNNILVFGANTQGRHSKGTSLLAQTHFDAIYGQPKGLQGRSYAIITKDLTEKIHPSISKEFIAEQIINLYYFAIERPTLNFYIPYNEKGKNLNAYSSQEMAEMFNQEFIPENIIFENSFAHLIHKLNNKSIF